MPAGLLPNSVVLTKEPVPGGSGVQFAERTNHDGDGASTTTRLYVPEGGINARTPEYSICITHYNDVSTVKSSLESILKQVSAEFEIVVVDQASTDGSFPILLSLAQKGTIRLFAQKTRNRGAGRQLAFEKSQGKYIIGQMDMDDIFLPTLRELLHHYHAVAEGKVLRVKRSIVDSQEHSCGVTIAPRELLVGLGGWRPLNWYEDADLWNRALESNVLVEIEFPILIRSKREIGGLIQRMKHRYLTYKECERAGLWEQKLAPRVGILTYPLYVAGVLAAKLHPLAPLREENRSVPSPKMAS